MTSNDEIVTDGNDDFDVIERKRPRELNEAFAPGVTPEPIDAASPLSGGLTKPVEDVTLPGMGNWLSDEGSGSMFEETQRAEARSPDDEDDTHVTDPVPMFMDLPDPPAEPMREEPPAPEPARSSSFGRFAGSAAAPPPAPSAHTPMTSPPMSPPNSAPHATPSPFYAAPPAASSSSASSSSSATRGTSMRIAIAATEFNYDITSMMIERAKAHADFLGAEVVKIVRVPGVYDLPLAIKRLLRHNDVDGVVTLGVVIEGETDHDDLVIQHAARKIMDLGLDADKPVGLGITGPGMSRLQAEARIDRAKDAVEAVVRLHRDLAGL